MYQSSCADHVLLVRKPQVAARSRQLLIEYNSPSAEQRRAQFLSAVEAAAKAATDGDGAARQSTMDTFVSRPNRIVFETYL